MILVLSLTIITVVPIYGINPAFINNLHFYNLYLILKTNII